MNKESQTEIIMTKIDIARSLENKYYNSPYFRLAQIGGFLIRNIDVWNDFQNYKNERNKFHYSDFDVKYINAIIKEHNSSKYITI